MIIKTNFASRPARKPVLAAGQYTAEITNITQPEAASVTIEFTILQNEHEGLCLSAAFRLTPQEGWRLERLLKAVALRSTAELDTAKLFGKRLLLILAVTGTSGNKRNEIVGYQRVEPPPRLKRDRTTIPGTRTGAAR